MKEKLYFKNKKDIFGNILLIYIQNSQNFGFTRNFPNNYPEFSLWIISLKQTNSLSRIQFLNMQDLL